MLEIAKTRQGELPWYERAISVVGVIALFSAITATFIQTVRATDEAGKTDRLRVELTRITQERAELESLMIDVAAVSVQQYRQTGRLESAQETVLLRRLKQLAALRRPSDAEVLETYQIALLLRDYNLAGLLLDKYVELTR